MTYFCSNCWHEINKEDSTCPHCGIDQSVLGQEPFVKKLIRALNHPEPSTPIRAAEILGELKANEAVPFLINLIGRQDDPFIIKAALNSIKKIGDVSSLSKAEALCKRK